MEQSYADRQLAIEMEMNRGSRTLGPREAARATGFDQIVQEIPPPLYQQREYPTMSRREAENFVKRFSRSMAEAIRDTPGERQEKEVNADAFLFRMAMRRTISRLEKAGYIWGSAKPSSH